MHVVKGISPESDFKLMPSVLPRYTVVYTPVFEAQAQDTKITPQ